MNSLTKFLFFALLLLLLILLLCSIAPRVRLDFVRWTWNATNLCWLFFPFFSLSIFWISTQWVNVNCCVSMWIVDCVKSFFSVFGFLPLSLSLCQSLCITWRQRFQFIEMDFREFSLELMMGMTFSHFFSLDAVSSKFSLVLSFASSFPLSNDEKSSCASNL